MNIRAVGAPERADAGHPAPRRAVGVDQAAFGPLDPVGAARGVLLIIGIAIILAAIIARPLAAPERRGSAATSTRCSASLTGVNFAQLAVGVLGVLVITASTRPA